MEQETLDGHGGLPWRLFPANDAGNVLLEWAGDGPLTIFNPGPQDQVAEALARWLCQMDYGECT